jgi:hypothetical protein
MVGKEVVGLNDDRGLCGRQGDLPYSWDLELVVVVVSSVYWCGKQSVLAIRGRSKKKKRAKPIKIRWCTILIWNSPSPLLTWLGILRCIVLSPTCLGAVLFLALLLH